MAEQILADAEAFPDFFDLRLPGSRQEVDGLESELGITLPPSFRHVLETVGQGSFFDNETLLGVHETEDGVGDLSSINRELRDKQSLSPGLVVFHIGLGGLHAFDTEGAGPEYEVVALDEDTLARGDVFRDFEDWYHWLRGEYASLLDLE